MDKMQSWATIDIQRGRIADLLESLSAQEWEAPSLCEGWRVRDVAAHLSIAATMPTSDVLRAAARAHGNFDRMIRDSAIARAERPVEAIVEDLRSIVGSRRLAPTTMWRDPLLDVLVHAQDIAQATGRDFPMPVEAARTAADWTSQRRFPFFPARRLRGVRLVACDIDWTRGHGDEVRGPIASLLLICTGRPAGMAGISGPGLPRVQRRFARMAT